jgi:hypothetical protein
MCKDLNVANQGRISIYRTVSWLLSIGSSCSNPMIRIGGGGGGSNLDRAASRENPMVTARVIAEDVLVKGEGVSKGADKGVAVGDSVKSCLTVVGGYPTGRV